VSTTPAQLRGSRSHLLGALITGAASVWVTWALLAAVDALVGGLRLAASPSPVSIAAATLAGVGGGVLPWLGVRAPQRFARRLLEQAGETLRFGAGMTTGLIAEFSTLRWLGLLVGAALLFAFVACLLEQGWRILGPARDHDHGDD
jgi:hypothetical protein